MILWLRFLLLRWKILSNIFIWNIVMIKHQSNGITLIVQADSAAFKPGSASTLTPEAATVMTAMPLAETEEGLAVVWGKRCILLDDTFTKTGEIELPGNGDMVFAEDGTLWLTYVEKGVRKYRR